ncbi:histidine kinase [Chloroflexota bacterium]
MSDTPETQENSREKLLELLHSEHKQINGRLKEMQLQVEQSHNEVERLQQKNTMVTNRMHQIESNFDSVPRQDIRVAYNEAMDTRNRLLTMRGTLEKLQSDERNLKHMVDILSQILAGIEGLAPASFAGEEAASADASSATATIIRIIEAQENERQRLATQMHDGPAQSLTNYILQAEICQRLFNRDPDRAAEELNNLKTAASSTFQKIRDFIFDLRPMMLDDLGLIPTLRRYVEATADKGDFSVSLHMLGDERRLESHREVIIFRSVQELLGNARDHGKASQIKVTLDMGADTITCTVDDNGIGFNPEELFAEDPQSEAPENKALGIKTMRERLELVGGGTNHRKRRRQGYTNDSADTGRQRTSIAGAHLVNYRMPRETLRTHRLPSQAWRSSESGYNIVIRATGCRLIPFRTIRLFDF